jgi:ATP-dependent protease HslVU (ClpYQ) peptidase subunit
MSIVACKVTKDTIYLAADTQLTHGNEKRWGLKYKKIRRVAGLVVCSVGACSEADLFCKYIEEHEFPHYKKDIPIFMADFFKYKESFHDKMKTKDEEDISECTFLVVFKNNVYLIADLFVAKVRDFIAIGSGEGYAIGAMAMGATVQKAVEITCKYVCACGLPVQYMEIERR